MLLGAKLLDKQQNTRQACLSTASIDGIGGEGSNVINGDTESWHNMWSKLVNRLGSRIPAIHFTGQCRDFEGNETELAPEPPSEDHRSKIIGRGWDFRPTISSLELAHRSSHNDSMSSRCRRSFRSTIIIIWTKMPGNKQLEPLWPSRLAQTMIAL